MNNTEIPQNESNRYLGDLAALLLMIVGGTALVVWLSTLSQEDRQVLISKTVTIATLVLAQPGVFLAVKFANNDKLPWQKRLSYSLGSFLVLALALPSFLSTWFSSFLPL